jgi:hypothetical protein
MFGVIKLFNFIFLMLNLLNFIKRCFFLINHKDIGTLLRILTKVVACSAIAILLMVYYDLSTLLCNEWFAFLSDLYSEKLLQFKIHFGLVIHYTNRRFNELSMEIIYYVNILSNKLIVEIIYLLQVGFYYVTVGYKAYKAFSVFATFYYFMIKSYIYVSIVFVEEFISIIFLPFTLFIVLQDLYYHYLRNTLMSYVLSLRFHTRLLILLFFWWFL